MFRALLFTNLAQRTVSVILVSWLFNDWNMDDLLWLFIIMAGHGDAMLAGRIVTLPCLETRCQSDYFKVNILGIASVEADRIDSWNLLRPPDSTHIGSLRADGDRQLFGAITMQRTLVVKSARPQLKIRTKLVRKSSPNILTLHNLSGSSIIITLLAKFGSSRHPLWLCSTDQHWTLSFWLPACWRTDVMPWTRTMPLNRRWVYIMFTFLT